MLKPNGNGNRRVKASESLTNRFGVRRLAGVKKNSSRNTKESIPLRTFKRSAENSQIIEVTTANHANSNGHRITSVDHLTVPNNSILHQLKEPFLNIEPSPIALETTLTMEDGELSQAQLEHLSELMIDQMFDGSRPLDSFWEYLMVAFGVVVGFGAIVNSFDFSRKFVQGAESDDVQWIDPNDENEVQGWIYSVAISNMITQFCLTITSFVTITVNQLRYGSQHIADDTKDLLVGMSYTDLFYYTAYIPFTALGSAYMVHHTLDNDPYNTPPEVSYFAAFLSFLSSLLVNINFYKNRSAEVRGDRDDLDMVKVCKRAKAILLAQARAKDIGPLLDVLQNGELLALLLMHCDDEYGDTFSAREQLVKLMDLLDEHLSEFEDPETTEEVKKTCLDNVVTVLQYLQWWVSFGLGIASSLTNFEAGWEAPSLFGMPTTSDIAVYFKNIKNLGPGDHAIAALGAYWGTACVYVNTIINGFAFRSFTNDLKDLVKSLWDNGPSQLLRYVSREGVIVLGILLFAAGYAIGKAGSGYEFTFIQIPPVPMLTLYVSLLVFFPLGVRSINGLVGNIRNAWNRYLLDNAIEATIQSSTGLTDYYYSLKAAPDRRAFELVLENAITRGLDSIVRSASNIKGDYAQQIWSSKYPNEEPFNLNNAPSDDDDDKKSQHGHSPSKKSSSPELRKNSIFKPVGTDTGYGTQATVPVYSPQMPPRSPFALNHIPLRRASHSAQDLRTQLLQENFSLNSDGDSDTKTPHLKLNGQRR